MHRNRPALFKGRHFEAEIIILCVRWYLRFGLSFRNLEEMMAERNLAVDHVTIWRWVQRYAPELHRRCRPELRMTNRSWRVDETYLRVAGKWTYLYRAVDSVGTRLIFSYDVLSTTTWFLSFTRQRNCTASGSRWSRPSRMILMQNGAEEARARRGLPRRSEPLPPSTVLLLPARRRTVEREPDAWIPGGEFPSLLMTPPPIQNSESLRTPICSSASDKLFPETSAPAR